MNSLQAEIKKIGEDLELQGWSFSDSFVAKETSLGLLAKIEILATDNLLAPAKIGRQNIERRENSARGDLIHWIEEIPTEPSEQNFYQAIQELQEHLKRHFYLPVHTREFHYALYPPGARYEKHLDQHQGQNSRILSVVHYLNSDWTSSDGGRLRIYDPKNPGTVAIEIDPRLGRSVFFLSDQILHEVLPAHQPRRSVTGWLRR